MGRDRYRIHEPGAPHFLTCSVVQWLPLFADPGNVKILLDSLRFLHEQDRLVLYGYVVMENHCHFLAAGPDLPTALASFKSFTGRRIIERLEINGSPVLRLLSFHKARHKRDRRYQVWEEGMHPKLIQGEAMMRQKLQYIHNNPVKRGYVEDPCHWRYSSARNYGGDKGLIDVETGWLDEPSR